MPISPAVKCCGVWQRGDLEQGSSGLQELIGVQSFACFAMQGTTGTSSVQQPALRHPKCLCPMR